MVQCRPAFSVANSYVCPGPFPWATQWGQLDGLWAPPAASAPGVSWAVGVELRLVFPGLVTILITSFGGWGVTRRGAERLSDRTLKIVTWLILPVVICLSQRLSHACLSISNLYGETANGSLNQLSFI